MPRRKTKPLVERARAAQRLALDGSLLPLTDLTGVAGCSVRALVRFGTEGRGGVYLDVVKEPLRGWCSSVAAVQRFLRAWAERSIQKEK